MQLDPLDVAEVAEAPHRLGAATKVLLSILAAFGGWVAVTGATHIWNLKADRATVEQMAEDIRSIKDAQVRIETKVDSTNFRITQIHCGPALQNGCR